MNKRKQTIVRTGDKPLKWQLEVQKLSDMEKEDIINVMQETWGNVAQTAKILNIDSAKLRSWVLNDPVFFAKLEEIRKARVEMAENKLLNLINMNHFGAIKFFLQTQGRKEGYNEKVDVNLTTQPLDTERNFIDFDIEALSDDELKTLRDIKRKQLQEISVDAQVIDESDQSKTESDSNDEGT